MGAFAGSRWGSSHFLYREGVDEDVADAISARIAYAKTRWGCSLFYIDSNGYERRTPRKVIGFATPWEEYAGAPMRNRHWQKIARAHPDVLLIPEHESLGHWACTSPLNGFTTPETRAYFPQATTALFLQFPEYLTRNFAQYVTALQQGDFLLGNVENPFVAAAFTEAGWRSAPLDPRVKEAQTAGALLALLQDPAPLVRFQAGTALSTLHTGQPDAQAVQAMARMLAGDADWAVRRAAADWLSVPGGPLAFTALMEFITAAPATDRPLFDLIMSRVANQNAATLIAWGAPELAGKMAKHKLPHVRYCAASLLASIATGNAIQALTRLANDPDPLVRGQVKMCLRQLPNLDEILEEGQDDEK